MATYLFRGSNIGPNGIFRDAQNVPEMLYLIQKKFFGLANTLPDLIIGAETKPNSVLNIPNAFSYINQKKIYGQEIPLSNPMLASSFNTYSIDLTKCFLDPTFSNVGQPIFFGKTMLNNINSAKYISCNYPYICYYSNICLTDITKTGTTLYNTFKTTYGHPKLQNAISGFYDLSYTPRLYYSNTNIEITNLDGYWLLDTDAGVLTFYDSNTIPGYQVDASSPPYISFFRYEGLFGEANILTDQTL